MDHLASESASAPIGHPTAEDAFGAWRFNRDAIHFNGGREFFGWGHRCIDQPRLLVIDKYFKKDRSTQRSYLIDGKTPCTTIAEAVAALAAPPALTDDEREKLATVTAAWMQPTLRGPLIPLADMGLIEWGRDADDRVTCRLTADGRKIAAEQITNHLTGAPASDPGNSPKP